jgi:acetyltransferase-like isoleucine patch superfamily enzyme
MIGKMIKKFIRRICYKIYCIGRFEDRRIYNQKRIDELSKLATIDSTAYLSSEVGIFNNSRPKECISIGARSRIMGDLFLFDSGGSISIGKDCFLGPASKIWSADNITIGDRVLIAHNVNIHDNISHPLNAKIRHEEFMNFAKTGFHQSTDLKAMEVKIEDDVWIGFNSIILKGVKIGRGAIIGAGSVVTKDVEPWTVNVGNPLRCIYKLDPINF